MNQRHSFTVLCAFLAAALWTLPATAQTPANIVIALGNGQLVSSNSAGEPTFYQNVFAIVTDANGNPIPYTPVSWTMLGLGILANSSSTTDGNGVTAAQLFPPNPAYGNFTTPTFVSMLTVQAGNASATFTETDAPQDTGGHQYVYAYGPGPLNLSGAAGSTGTSFKMTVMTNGGSGVPNVAVRLVNLVDGTAGPSASNASAYCSTGSGADPYSVLTDQTGTATCNVVFGPVQGSVQLAVMVGGAPVGEWSIPGTTAGSLFSPSLSPVSFTPGTPPTFFPAPYSLFTGVSASVTPATVSSVTATSGGGQQANPGNSLPSPLVVTVNGPSGPLTGQQVTWSATPGAAVQFANPTTTTGSNGQTSNTVTFTAAASGPVTIRATAAANTNFSATFTETAVSPLSVTSLVKVSGDGQTALVGTAFASLQVQVFTSNGSVASIPISFSLSGPASFAGSSTVTVNTNGSGIAQATVNAGATAGAVMVTASVGSMSVTFNLTVAPPVTFTANSFVNGADQKAGSVSACGLATLAASNLVPSLSGTLTSGLVGPGQLTLGNTSIVFTGPNGGDPAPIFSVSVNAITFQVPCDLPAGATTVTANIGGATNSVSVTLLPASPGIFQTIQSGVSYAVIERPDGSFASTSNPARRGETVTAFLTGLGPVSPSVSTNALPIPQTQSTVSGQVIVGVNNAGTQVLSSQLSPTQPGVYLVSFTIPQNAPQSNSVPFSIAVIPSGSSTPYYSAGTVIPVQ